MDIDKVMSDYENATIKTLLVRKPNYTEEEINDRLERALEIAESKRITVQKIIDNLTKMEEEYE